MSNNEAKPRKTRRRYTAEFKSDAVTNVIRSGQPAAAVARELGIKPNLLAKWVRLHLAEKDQEAGETDGLSPSESAAEIKRLRRELGHVSEQRDILKKVLAILSSDENSRSK